MLRPREHLIERAADGRIGLNVSSDRFFDHDPVTHTFQIRTHTKSVSYSEDWFMLVHEKGTKIIPNPPSGKINVSIYLSEKGWNVMKPDILHAFEMRSVFRDCGVTGHIKGFDRFLMAYDFEKIIHEFYENIRREGQSHYIDGLIYKYAKEEMKKSKKPYRS